MEPGVEEETTASKKQALHLEESTYETTIDGRESVEGEEDDLDVWIAEQGGSLLNYLPNDPESDEDREIETDIEDEDEISAEEIDSSLQEIEQLLRDLGIDPDSLEEEQGEGIEEGNTFEESIEQIQQSIEEVSDALGELTNMSLNVFGDNFDNLFNKDNVFSLVNTAPSSFGELEEEEAETVPIEEFVPSIEDMLTRLRNNPRRWEKMAHDPEFADEFVRLCLECDKQSEHPAPYQFQVMLPYFGGDEEEKSEWILSLIQRFVATIEPRFLWIHESMERRAHVIQYLQERNDLKLLNQVVSPDPVISSYFQEPTRYGRVREFEKFDKWIELGIWRNNHSDVRLHWKSMRTRLLTFGAQTNLTRGEWIEGLAWYTAMATDVLEGFIYNALQHALPLLRSFFLNYCFSEEEKVSLEWLEQGQKLLLCHAQRYRQRETERTASTNNLPSEHFSVFVPFHGDEKNPLQAPSPWNDHHEEQDTSAQGALFAVNPSLLSLTLLGLLSDHVVDIDRKQEATFKQAQLLGHQGNKALLVLSRDPKQVEKLSQQVLDNEDTLGSTRILFLLQESNSIFRWPRKRKVKSHGRFTLCSTISSGKHGLDEVKRYIAYLECLDALLMRRSMLESISDQELARGIRLYEAAGHRKRVVELLDEKIERGDRPGMLLRSLLNGKLEKAYNQAEQFLEEVEREGESSPTNRMYWLCVSHLLSSFGRLATSGVDATLSSSLEQLSQKLLRAQKAGETQPGWRAKAFANLLRAGEPLERLFHNIHVSGELLEALTQELMRIGNRGERSPLFLTLRTALHHWIQIRQFETLQQCSEAEAIKMYLATLSQKEREEVEDEYLDQDSLLESDPRFTLYTQELQRYFRFKNLVAAPSPGRFAFPEEIGRELLALWRQNVEKHAGGASCLARFSKTASGELRLELSDQGPGLSEAGLDRLRNRYGSFGKLLLEGSWFSRVLVLSFSLQYKHKSISLLGEFSQTELRQLKQNLMHERGCTFVLESPSLLE